MHNKLSIFEYYTRRILPVWLAVTVVMAAAEIVVIKTGLARGNVDLTKLRNTMLIIFFAAQLVICLLIGGPSARKSNYLLKVRMLGVSERAAYLTVLAVNALAFLAVWGVQMMITGYLAKAYMALPEYHYGPQGMFNLIVGQDGMQAMLPMDRGLYWFDGISTVLAFAAAAAGIRSCRRYRKVPVIEVMIIGNLVLLVVNYIGDGSGVTYAGVVLFIALLSAAAACMRAGSEDGKTEVALNEE